RIGAYRIGGEIGRGGMGAVYLATRDDDQFHKRVAIKVVKPGMDTSEVLARFRYERQILANLDHPYIASLYDGGTTRDGRPFFVMEYVEGQPVNLYCSEHGLNVEARCRLFVSICEAVAHAHRNLVVHRDLKPANILITAQAMPKLLDFGLAKLLDRNASGHTTAAMVRHFTPAYASPEQVRGLPVTTATDIYSLGAILYELLSGRRAHEFADQSAMEMQRIVCEAEPVRPGAIVQNLDPDLDNIVLMAMRKEPERRYQSVDQFAEDIRNYLASRPVLARKDSFGYRARKFAGRKRYALAAGGAVLASLLVGVVIAIWQAHKAIVERQRAEIRLEEITNLSDHLLSEVYSSMERLAGAMPARREFVGSTLDLLAKLSQEAGNDRRLRFTLAKAYLRMGDLQGDPDSANIGDMPGAGNSYRLANSLLGSFAASQGAERLGIWVDVQNKLAANYSEMGDHIHAAATVQNALSVVESNAAIAGAASDAWKGTLYLSLSKMTPDMPMTLRYAQQALAYSTKAAERSPSDLVTQMALSSANTHLAYTYKLMGNPEAAEPFSERSMRIRERLYREHPSDQTLRRYLKLAYEHYAELQGSPDFSNLGHPEIARVYFEKARPLEEADLADPQNSSARFDYALYLIMAARVGPRPGGEAKSLADLHRAASTFEALGAAEPNVERYRRSFASARVYSGDLLVTMARFGEAIAAYDQALAILNPLLAALPEHPTALVDAFAAERGKAMALMSMGDEAGALNQAHRLLERARTAPPAVRVFQVAHANLTLAKLYAKFNDCTQARAAAARSAQAIRPLVGATTRDPNRRVFEAAESIRRACTAAAR
ncbi:MAG TPA: serine/threonine-protein kinase, partial [Bryobacteraceae bacterium]|nr:serine/threonine-protein kinase [Bryobacteraceae bacterium]